MNTLHEGPPDVLAALRAATKDQHALLDARLPIAAAAPTLAAYQQHLTALRAWLLPMRDWLARFDDGPQAGGLVSVSARLALIDADLADPTLARAPADAPVPAPEAPASDAPAYRWGACYVIEGSQLGGAVLYRRLGVALQPHPLRYLSADSVAPGPRWAGFIAGLREGVREPAAIAAACAGARDAFDAILAIHGLAPAHQP